MEGEKEFHELANLFPMMGDLEYQSLVKDIKENGLQEPILLFEDKILDGRNRYRACRDAGVQLDPDSDFADFDGDRAAAERLSTSRNLTRRHLSKSQKAMLIARMGLAKPPNGAAATADAISIRAAAARYGVNHLSIYKAFFVHERSTALSDAVVEGKLSVAKAESELRGGQSEKLEGLTFDSPEEAFVWLRSELSRASGARQKRALKQLQKIADDLLR